MLVSLAKRRGDEKEIGIKVKAKRVRPLEISRFVALEFSCQTLFAFTFIMGVGAIKSASGRAACELSSHAGRGQMPAPIPTTYALDKFWHADNYVGLRGALHDPRDKWCVQRAHARIRTNTSGQH